MGEHWKEAIGPIKSKIQRESNLVNIVWILGGEPLDQDLYELRQMMLNIRLSRREGVDIVLFTRYELHQIPDEIKCLTKYIKTGTYEENQKFNYSPTSYGIDLASVNQEVHAKGIDY